MRIFQLLVENPETNLEAILQDAAVRYSAYAPGAETVLPGLPLTEADAKKVTEYELSIDGYVKQATVQFITGALDIESNWDSYIERLYSMGLEEYMDIYQYAYDMQQNVGK